MPMNPMMGAGMVMNPMMGLAQQPMTINPMQMNPMMMGTCTGAGMPGMTSMPSMLRMATGVPGSLPTLVPTSAQAGMVRPAMSVPVAKASQPETPPMPDLSSTPNPQDERAVVVRALKEIAEKEMKRTDRSKAEDRPTAKDAQEEEKESRTRCFLHKKPNPKCKKCQQDLEWSSAKDPKEEDKSKKAREEKIADTAKNEEERRSFQCSPMLKEQIMKSAYFKSLLEITNVEGLITEIAQYADTLDVYDVGSRTSPSCFMCQVYRLFTLPHVEDELNLVLDNTESAVVRCVGFLYVRFATQPTHLWEMLEDYLFDDMELVYQQEGREIITSIGEFVESLLIREKYFDTPLPRIPVKVRQELEVKIAPMPQHRKRMQANLRLFKSSSQMEDQPVEVCMDGTWLQGTAQALTGNAPFRMRVRVWLDNGLEVKAHLGRVVLSNQASSPRGSDSGGESDSGHRRRRRRSSRSRSRRGGHRSPDWSRWKGKTDAEMVQELRERAKEDAVCGHGKVYAKRPLTIDASMASTALLDPTSASEDKHGCEGGGPAGGKGGKHRMAVSLADQEDQYFSRKRRNEEEEERQRKLRDVYEKYCSAKPVSASGARSVKEVDEPDVLRLG